MWKISLNLIFSYACAYTVYCPVHLYIDLNLQKQVVTDYRILIQYNENMKKREMNMKTISTESTDRNFNLRY